MPHRRAKLTVLGRKLSYVAQGVVAAVVTFLAIAALRVAWASFDQPRGE